MWSMSSKSDYFQIQIYTFTTTRTTPGITMYSSKSPVKHQVFKQNSSMSLNIRNVPFLRMTCKNRIYREETILRARASARMWDQEHENTTERQAWESIGNHHLDTNICPVGWKDQDAGKLCREPVEDEQKCKSCMQIYVCHKKYQIPIS